MHLLYTCPIRLTYGEGVLISDQQHSMLIAELNTFHLMNSKKIVDSIQKTTTALKL